jgi:hypothetical protein
MNPFVLSISFDITKRKRKVLRYRFEKKEDRDMAFKLLKNASCLSFPSYQILLDEQALAEKKKGEK